MYKIQVSSYVYTYTYDFTTDSYYYYYKSFVESSKSIKWCPVAGCGRAVKLPEMEQIQSNSTNSPPGKTEPLISHAVDCGNGHFFCW